MIQKRDRQLFGELAVMRVADREQIKTVAGFGSVTRVNTRLLALTRAGLLRRFFLGTTAGGAKALYALSAKGAESMGLPLRGPRRRQDEAFVANFFVSHQLAVNDIYCALRYRPVPMAGVRFRRWHCFHEPVSPRISLIPDGYVELETPSGIVASFLEIDLGNESLPVWTEKVKKYLEFALTENSSIQIARPFRVMVIAHSERRMRSIRETVAALTNKLFWFASHETIHRDGLFASLWLRPTGEERLPLVKEPKELP